MWLFLLCYSKSFTGFSGIKESTSQGICNFFVKMFQMRFSRCSRQLKITLKLTRAALWIILKISNRNKSTTLLIFLFCHYFWSLLWCKCWKSLKMDSHRPKALLYLLQWNPFKNDEKCFLFLLKTSPCPQDF